MSSFKSVCIIDDDKIYTFGVKKIIRTYIPGNDVITFENGRKAMDSIKEMYESNQELPDLILLDIDMPEMNGWDFLNEFESLRKKVDKEIQVFVISSKVSESSNELYRVEWDEKVSDFIRKPVDIEVLKNLIN